MGACYEQLSYLARLEIADSFRRPSAMNLPGWAPAGGVLVQPVGLIGAVDVVAPGIGEHVVAAGGLDDLARRVVAKAPLIGIRRIGRRVGERLQAAHGIIGIAGGNRAAKPITLPQAVVGVAGQRGAAGAFDEGGAVQAIITVGDVIEIGEGFTQAVATRIEEVGELMEM